MSLFIQLGELTGSTLSFLPFTGLDMLSIEHHLFLKLLLPLEQAFPAFWSLLVSLMQQLVNSMDGWTNGRGKKKKGEEYF